MRLGIEYLERRDLLVSNIAIDLAGPATAYFGDPVSYKVVVTNNSINPITADDHFNSPIDDLQLSLDGDPWDSAELIELAVGQSALFEVTGTAPNSSESSLVLYFSLRIQSWGGVQLSTTLLAGQSTVLLDNVVDQDTVGAGINWAFTDGQGALTVPSDAVLVDVVPTGDSNGDGVADVDVDVAYQRYYTEDEQLKFDLELVRRTISDNGSPRYVWLDGTEEKLMDSLRGLVEIPFGSDWERYFQTGNVNGNEFEIGDVDGDGFQDILKGDPRELGGTGTATIYFGPDFRENYVIVGNDRAGQMHSETYFGRSAGSLGDINGDGFGDFFVEGGPYEVELHLLHGRDFERTLTGDFDADGEVGFTDFLLLSANYGKENVAREDGDLDGDGAVGFTDFLIFNRQFG